MEILADLEGVDEALDRDPAAQRFWLIDSRIGDITVFGASDRVFDDATEGTSLAICVATGPYMMSWFRQSATGDISRSSSSKKTKTCDPLTCWDERRQSRLEDEASVLDWGTWFRP